MARKTISLKDFRPNPVRQAILAGLAIAGIGIGWGIGYVLNPAPVPKPATENTSPKPVAAKQQSPVPQKPHILPEPDALAEKPLAYEEALPEGTVHFPVVIPPRPIKKVPEKTLEPNQPVQPSIVEKLSEPVPSAENREMPIEIPETGQTSSENFEKSQSADQVETAPAITPTDETPEAVLLETSEQPTEKAEEGSEVAVVPHIPNWQKYALEVQLRDVPKIAIVIDDMGVDQRRSRLMTEMPGPLTLSYLTYARNLKSQTDKAQKSGHELMLHVPMEPTSHDVDPGPNVLLSNVPLEQSRKALVWGLSQFDGFVGINNHMGSRFTSNLEGMQMVMKELKSRELFFLDSVTSGSTKGRAAAKNIGVPFIARNIFLDHVDDRNAIEKQLQEVELLALQNGYAIAIGHPRDATLDALKPWLQTIESKGFQLVPVSALIRLEMQNEIAAKPSE